MANNKSRRRHAKRRRRAEARRKRERRTAAASRPAHAARPRRPPPSAGRPAPRGLTRNGKRLGALALLAVGGLAYWPLWFGFALVAGWTAVTYRRSQSTKVARVLGAALAERLGLTLVVAQKTKPPTLRGRLDGLGVHVELRRVVGRAAPVSMVLLPDRGVPSELTFEANELSPGGVQASGPPDRVATVLDSRVCKAVRDGLTVEASEVRIGETPPPTAVVAWATLARDAAALARHMADAARAPPADRLAELAAGDSEPTVRLRALRRLVAGFPDEAKTQPTLSQARYDPDERVRQLARRHLPADEASTAVGHLSLAEVELEAGALSLPEGGQLTLDDEPPPG